MCSFMIFQSTIGLEPLITGVTFEWFCIKYGLFLNIDSFWFFGDGNIGVSGHVLYFFPSSTLAQLQDIHTHFEFNQLIVIDEITWSHFPFMVLRKAQAKCKLNKVLRMKFRIQLEIISSIVSRNESAASSSISMIAYKVPPKVKPDWLILQQWSINFLCLGDEETPCFPSIMNNSIIIMSLLVSYYEKVAFALQDARVRFVGLYTGGVYLNFLISIFKC